MKFGLAFAQRGHRGRRRARHRRSAEAAGFESVWGGEHVILPTVIESSYRSAA